MIPNLMMSYFFVPRLSILSSVVKDILFFHSFFFLHVLTLNEAKNSRVSRKKVWMLLESNPEPFFPEPVLQATGPPISGKYRLTHS